MTIETAARLAVSAGDGPLSVAVAYIGPGAGLASIGALLAVGSAAIVMFVGLVWYPIKQMRRKWKTRQWKARQAKKDPDDDPPAPTG